MAAKVHRFTESLASSHRAENLPFWRELYRNAFPTMVSMVNHRTDGPWQRQGIDRSITLQTSKQILIDEKVRWKDWGGHAQGNGDIALEVWSDKERREPGWVCKPLLADYIAYAVAPAGKAYLLPVIQLQSAWAECGESWSREFYHPIAQNREHGCDWQTESVAVPVRVLFRALGQGLRVSFTPFAGGSD